MQSGIHVSGSLLFEIMCLCLLHQLGRLICAWTLINRQFPSNTPSMEDEARQAGQARYGNAEKFLYGTDHYVALRLQPSWNQESELFWKAVSCSISASYSFGWMSPVDSNVSPTKVNHTEATKTDMTTDAYLVHCDKSILSEKMLHRHAAIKHSGCHT